MDLLLTMAIKRSTCVPSLYFHLDLCSTGLPGTLK